MYRTDSIQNVKNALDSAGIFYAETASGREIIFGKKGIKINHNGARHWTIRVPGAAKDGIRLDFNVTLTVADGLFIVNDTLAIKYD